MRNGTVWKTFGTLVCCLVLLGCRSGRPWETIIHEDDPAQTRADILKRIPIGTPLDEGEAALEKIGFTKMEDPSKWSKPEPGTAPIPGGRIAEDARYVTYWIDVPIDSWIVRSWYVQLHHAAGAVQDIKVTAGGLTGP